MSHVDFGLIHEYLRNGTIPETYNTRVGRTNFKRTSQKFALNGKYMVFVGGKKKAGTAQPVPCEPRKVITTVEEKDEIFREIHDSAQAGHMGMRKTLQAITSRFYWHAIQEDVIERIKNCATCQCKDTPKVRRKLHPIVTQEAWEAVAVDVIGPLTTTKAGNEFIVTVTCLFTKFVVAFAIPDKLATSVSRTLQDLCYMYGPPKKVITDQGQEFVNSVNTEILKLCEVQHMVTLAYHPVTKRQDDKTKGNLQHILKELVDENVDDWDERLKAAVFALNITPHPSTTFTPYLLMFSRHPTELSSLNGQDAGENDKLVAYPNEPTALQLEEYATRVQGVESGLRIATSANIEKAKAKQKKS